MSDDEDEFSEIRGALGSIGLSALVVLGGAVLSQGMGFGTRVVMTRFLPVDGYGDIVLGITVLNLLGVVSILGLGAAMTRYLPRAESDREKSEVTAAIYQIGMGLSLAWGAAGFLAADLIAGAVFGRPEMANVVRVFALSLPFYVLFKLSLKGIQGQKKTKPNVLTKQVMLPVTRLGAVAALALGGFGVVGLAIGFNAGFALAGVAGFLLFLRTGPFQLRSLLTPARPESYRSLLAFSIPLAVTGSIGIVTKQSDVFLLGVLGTSDMVGIYDVVFLTSQFILFFSPALNYLFQPLMAGYHADGDNDKMDKLYTIITRWIVILSFPIFALLVIAPGSTLATFFGPEYRAGGTALAILAVGYFAGSLVGLSGSFLVATGETKTLMHISTGTAVLNIGLNVVLIPLFGIIGAAVATGSAGVLNNVLQAGYVYRKTGIHPLEREIIVPSVLTATLLIGALSILRGSDPGFLEGFGLSISMGIVFLFFIAATRSVYMIELKLLDSLFKKLGIDLAISKRLAMLSKTS